MIAFVAQVTAWSDRIPALFQQSGDDLARLARPGTDRHSDLQLRAHHGKQHAMPCHHALAEALRAYIDATGIALRTARAGCSAPRVGTTEVPCPDKAMSQPDAWRMIRRRAAAAGIAAEIGCHTATPSVPLGSLLTSPMAARSTSRAENGGA